MKPYRIEEWPMTQKMPMTVREWIDDQLRRDPKFRCNVEMTLRDMRAQQDQPSVPENI